MKSLKNIKISPLGGIYAVFIALEAVIFICFNVLFATLPSDPIAVKYSGVLLCFAFALIMIYFHRADGATVSVALAFTAVSDLFILVLDDYYEVGVSTFFVAQSIYFFRLYYGRGRKALISVAVRAALAAVALIALGVTVGLNYLLVAVSVYFAMLVVNCADAFISFLFDKSLKKLLFAVGLLLFICCDVCVGLHNFDTALGVELPTALTAFCDWSMWIFYLPSQVAIACSIGGFNERKKGG